MALIGQIRKNFWFVLILLGLALAAFILMDIDSAGNRAGLGAQQIVGEVAGQKIDYQDFQRTETALYSGNPDTYARRNSVWNYYIEKSILDNMGEKMGLGVSRDELMDLQYGTNLSPVIQNNFRNPQTGQVDMQTLLQYKQMIENGEEMSEQFKLFWREQAKQIKKTAVQDKLNNMVSKAMFTPTFVVEQTGANQNSSVTFDYVKVPFDAVDDSEVELTDADIQNYIKENAFRYERDEETRDLAYAVINVLPTAEDSAKWRSDLVESIKNFRTTTNDSTFVINQEGFYSPVYQSAETLSEALQSRVVEMEVGDITGPYFDNGAYFAAKLIDKGVIADSVEARHILRNVEAGNPGSLAEATAYIDSLKSLITSGRESFADLAQANGQDGTASNGGDLGTFSQGSMVPEFNNLVFYNSKKGGLYTVTTQYGVHLVEVMDKIYNNREDKYKLAYIRNAIIPTQETQDRLFDQTTDMVAENRSLSALTTALEGKADVFLETAAGLKKNDFTVSDLGSNSTSRDIVRWAFAPESEVGNVSPSVHIYTDDVNYFNSKYVIAALKSINPKGLPSAESVRTEVEVAARNMKKAEMLASKITGTDLSAIASSYDTEVKTLDNVTFNQSGVSGLGNEPKVIATAFSLDQGGVSQPIKGDNGVYVVKTTAKTERAATANVVAQRKSLNNTSRSRVSFSLINALKEKFKPEDNRYTFF